MADDRPTLVETVSIADAKARFAELVARAEAGENLIITRRGKPVAELGALTESRTELVFGDLAHLGPVIDDLTLPDELIDLMANPKLPNASPVAISSQRPV